MNKVGSPRVQRTFAGLSWIHIVHGPDPDTVFRSRDGPGHELPFAGRTRTRESNRSRGGPGDDLQCSRGRSGHWTLPFAGRPGEGLSCGSYPASSAHGPDPGAGFRAGLVHTRASFTGRICEDETSASALCSTSWLQARHPRSRAGLIQAWRHELPGKGLPTSVRACSPSRTGSGEVQDHPP